jgi:hypothetical protein
MGWNLHWTIILASEDQHPAGDGILDALGETQHWLAGSGPRGDRACGD